MTLPLCQRKVILLKVNTIREYYFLSPHSCLFCIAPDAPVNVTIGTVTTTTVSISWIAPTSYNPDRIVRYDIEVTEGQLGLSPVKVNSMETSILVTGLEEHNKYSCKVAAVSNSQVGQFSSLVNFTTLEAGL